MTTDAMVTVAVNVRADEGWRREGDSLVRSQPDPDDINNGLSQVLFDHRQITEYIRDVLTGQETGDPPWRVTHVLPLPLQPAPVVTGKPVALVLIHDLLQILAGHAMTVRTTDDQEVQIRLYGTDEFIAYQHGLIDAHPEAGGVKVTREQAANQTRTWDIERLARPHQIRPVSALWQEGS